MQPSALLRVYSAIYVRELRLTQDKPRVKDFSESILGGQTFFYIYINLSVQLHINLPMCVRSELSPNFKPILQRENILELGRL